jgi:hypothetical protein
MPKHLEGLLANFDEKFAFIASGLLEDTGNGIIERSLDHGVISLDSILHYNKVGNQVFTLTSRMQYINGFDESFPAFQDYDTWVRLIRAFGTGNKISECSYIWHTGHEQDRISNNPKKRLLSLDMFINKHKTIMSKDHMMSMFIMKKKLGNKPFKLIELIMNINKSNFKTALSTYININFSWIGVKWRKYKKR